MGVGWANVNAWFDKVKRNKKSIFSYLADWIITIGLAVGFYMLDRIHGYQRVFSLQDTSLFHPYAEQEMIPSYLLFLICLVAPFLLQAGANFATVRSLRDFHLSTLGLMLSLSVTGAITQVVKMSVGRPRPDFVARCIPRTGAIDPPLHLSTVAVCTQLDETILRDGFKSFPSGHSSLSFAGMGFLMFYVAGKFCLFDRKGYTWKIWVTAAPFACATFVAISRTMDYRHHWQDVLAGSILGLSVSYLAYRQYFPSLESVDCDKSHPPRYEERLPLLSRSLTTRKGGNIQLGKGLKTRCTSSMKMSSPTDIEACSSEDFSGVNMKIVRDDDPENCHSCGRSPHQPQGVVWDGEACNKPSKSLSGGPVDWPVRNWDGRFSGEV